MTDYNEWSCPDSLIEFARISVRRSINFDPWTFEVSREIFIKEFVDNFLAYGKTICDTEKAFRKWVSVKSKYLADTLQYNDKLAARAVLGECSPADVLQEHSNYKEKNKRIFDDITTHHMNLKVDGWAEVTEKPADLFSYAQAADAMGQKPWVVEANRWLESFILDYYTGGGAKKAFLKCRKRARINAYRRTAQDENEGPLPPTMLAFLEYMSKLYEKNIPADICAVEGCKVRILDVGSCYNPFHRSPFASCFDVTALDLQPMDSTVYKCDFLDLIVGATKRTFDTFTRELGTVGEPEKLGASACSEALVCRHADDSKFSEPCPIAATTTAPINAVCGHLRLLELPAASYDAITMSLVLSYLPTPEHRRKMVAQARAFLYAPPLPHSCAAAEESCEAWNAVVHSAAGSGIAAESEVAGAVPPATGLDRVTGSESCPRDVDDVMQLKAEHELDKPLQEEFRHPYPGILVIAEKASIFGVGGNDSHVKLRRDWTNAICDEGFELLMYNDAMMAGHHVHVFAFKAVEITSRESKVFSSSHKERSTMRIKSDNIK